RSTPLTISVPSSRATCRFLISSCAIREIFLQNRGRSGLLPAHAWYRDRFSHLTLLRSLALRWAHAVRRIASRVAHSPRCAAARVRREAAARDGTLARQGHA